MFYEHLIFLIEETTVVLGLSGKLHSDTELEVNPINKHFSK